KMILDQQHAAGTADMGKSAGEIVLSKAIGRRIVGSELRLVAVKAGLIQLVSQGQIVVWSLERHVLLGDQHAIVLIVTKDRQSAGGWSGPLGVGTLPARQRHADFKRCSLANFWSDDEFIDRDLGARLLWDGEHVDADALVAQL